MVVKLHLQYMIAVQTDAASDSTWNQSQDSNQSGADDPELEDDGEDDNSADDVTPARIAAKKIKSAILNYPLVYS